MSHSVKKTFYSTESFTGSNLISGHSAKTPSQACSIHYGGTCKMHNGGLSGTFSNHGVSGGSKHCFRQGFENGHLYGKDFEKHNGWKNDGLFHINEKETMQLLNNRLASYMEKVHRLQEENSKLETEIKEWYNKNTPNTFPDFSNYFRIIEEMQNKISEDSVDNAKLGLYADNARLAADDFQNKYDMEIAFRHTVEGDLNSLRRDLDSLTLERCDLELQLENLQEDMVHLKKNHDEDLNSIRTKLGARVNVEVDAAPAVDLNKVLTEIRDEYEKLMERNIKDVEAWFISKSEELNSQVVSGSEQLQSVKSEVTDLRRTFQSLEIDLQAQLNTKSALEDTLMETEATYGSQLAHLQSLINNTEAQLSQLRHDLEIQNHEHKILMDVKTRLEMEISTYRRLLEGEDKSISWSHSSGGKGFQNGLKVVSITEEIENGKIVSTHEQIHQLKC